jgi:hypothetical protein
MSEIINLRQHRKVKSRTQKDKKAKENRSKFGRTKAEKDLKKMQDENAERHIEGHKRETDEDPDDDKEDN